MTVNRAANEESWVHFADDSYDAWTDVELEPQEKRDAAPPLEQRGTDNKTQGVVQAAIGSIGARHELSLSGPPASLPSPIPSEKDPPATPARMIELSREAEEETECCEALKRCFKSCFSRRE